MVLGLVQFALTGITVFRAIYVQDLLGFTPIEAGLSLLPLTLPLLLLAPRAGRIYDRVGPRVLVAARRRPARGSLVWAGLVLDQLDYWWLVPAYVVSGLGLAMVMTPASTDAMNTAPSALRGEASGVMQTMRQVGGTVGLAIMGTVAATIQADQLDDFAAQTGASAAQRRLLERALAEAKGTPAALQDLPPETVSEAQGTRWSRASRRPTTSAGAPSCSVPSSPGCCSPRERRRRAGRAGAGDARRPPGPARRGGGRAGALTRSPALPRHRRATSYLVTDVRRPGVSPAGIAFSVSSPCR